MNRLLIVSLSVMIGLLFGTVINNKTAASAAQEVYAVCNNARLEANGKTEVQCRELQDKYGIEFLCEARNSMYVNHCWTEIK